MVRLLPWMIVLLIAGSVLTEHEVHAQACSPCGPVKEEVQTPEQRIEKVLGEPTTFEYSETPFSKVVEDIGKRHNINVVLDKRALDDCGIGCDTPVTKSLKDISLRSALKITLKELELTWVIKDEVLLITTPECSDSMLTTKIYDVSDLAACRDEKGEIWYDCEPFITLVTSTAMPTTWSDVGGCGSVGELVVGETALLVISQTRPVHEEVADTLAKIRAAVRKHGDRQQTPPRRNREKPAQVPSQPLHDSSPMPPYIPSAPRQP